MLQQFKEIYVIDDDKIFVLITKKILENDSLFQKITVFSNGQEAVNHIRRLGSAESLPSLIFLDINMPIMDGWGFLDFYSDFELDGERPPVYLISSSIDQKDIDKSKHYTCVRRFISKPISKSIVANILKDLS